MSYAPNYNPTTSFADDETNSVAGRSTVKTDRVDTEFANVSTSLNALNANLKALQRDDGKLKDAIIEPYQFTQQTRAIVAAGGNPKGDWASGQSYNPGDAVVYTSIAYLCITQHTSTLSFDSTKWMPITDNGSAAVHATNAAASASAALTSQNAAAVSAAAALASQTSATTSANTATTQAGVATTQATNAANSAATATAQASAATTQAGNASASAAAAAQSAADAASAPVASPTHAATSKATPVDADEIPLLDSAASFVLKKLTILNLKSWIQSLLKSQTGTTFTTSGTAPNYVLTTSPAFGSYASDQRINATFHATGTTGSNVINIDGLGNKNLKQYDNTGTKQPAVIVSGMKTDLIYDGTDVIVLDALPASAAAAGGVRQTVQAAPVNTSGLPNYLPATSSGTTLTSTGVSSTVPIVVNAAGGGGSSGLADRVGVSTSNLSWTGLTVTNTVKNYLYVDVAANGTLTTGVTTVAPVYQPGGTPAVTSGLFTFNYGEMLGYLGNGSTAPQGYRVYVGEGTGNGTNVASIIAYGLNGRYDSGFFAITNNTAYTKSHNLGVFPVKSSSFITDSTTAPTWMASLAGAGYGSANTRGTGGGCSDANTFKIWTGAAYVWDGYTFTGASATQTSGQCRVVVSVMWA